MLTVERHGVPLNLDDRGFPVLPYVYEPAARGGWYEEAFLEHIRSLARPGAYVDVGAHLGTHTVWFATLCPSTVVHAFEPVARYADVLRRNVAANGLGSKVIVHQVGLGAGRGRVSNHLSREHQVGFDGPLEQAAAIDETFDVCRLDDALRSAVAVLKLDVEGMEASVLQGAARTLQHDRPVVFAEAHSERSRAAIEGALAPYGYAPSGRVFNASPTYEFVAPRAAQGALRKAVRRLPVPARVAGRRIIDRWRSGPEMRREGRL